MPKQTEQNYFHRWVGDVAGPLNLRFTGDGGFTATVGVADRQASIEDHYPARVISKIQLRFRERSAEQNPKHPWHGQVLDIVASRSNPISDMVKLKSGKPCLLEWDIKKYVDGVLQPTDDMSNYGLQWPGKWQLESDTVTTISANMQRNKRLHLPLWEKAKPTIGTITTRLSEEKSEGQPRIVRR